LGWKKDLSHRNNREPLKISLDAGDSKESNEIDKIYLYISKFCEKSMFVYLPY